MQVSLTIFTMASVARSPSGARTDHTPLPSLTFSKKVIPTDRNAPISRL